MRKIEGLRQHPASGQIEAWGVRDHLVLSSMHKVPSMVRQNLGASDMANAVLASVKDKVVLLLCH